MLPPVDNAQPLQFLRVGIDDGTLTDYATEWEHQRRVHEQVAAGDIGPQVIYVEHAPVYTAGRRTEPHERPFDGTPVVDVDRGGKITWHGPGQLVGYPIVRLATGIGVKDYVTRVEEAVIRYLADLGIPTGRIDGRTGVWLPATDSLPERKICAIGIRVLHRTTMHGFALNLSNSLAPYDNMIPCGIADAGVTTVEAELGHAPTVAEAADALTPLLADLLSMNQFTPTPDLHPALG